jgi:hypothetical protein
MIPFIKQSNRKHRYKTKTEKNITLFYNTLYWLFYNANGIKCKDPKMIELETYKDTWLNN